MATIEAGQTWRDIDAPVLKACAELLEDANTFDGREVAAHTGLDEETVNKALIRLGERYLHIKVIESWGGPVDAIVRGLTAEGLEATGVWPSPEDVTARLIVLLERELDGAAVDSPKANRLTALLGAVREMGTGAGAGFIGQALLRAAGLG